MEKITRLRNAMEKQAASVMKQKGLQEIDMTMCLARSDCPCRCQPDEQDYCRYSWDLAALQEQAEQRLKRDEKNFKGFADEIIDAGWSGVNLDGADIQEIAVKHGLLKEVTRTERCGDKCDCVDVVEFPTQCFDKTYQA